jgi:hypothetical protein
MLKKRIISKAFVRALSGLSISFQDLLAANFKGIFNIRLKSVFVNPAFAASTYLYAL